MKAAFISILGATIIVVAGIVTYRLSPDALALILGVLLGFAALIPTLLMAVIVMRKNQSSGIDKPATMPVHAQPQSPVIIVSGGYPAMASGQNQAQQHVVAGMIPPPAPSQPRQFRVMGYEATEMADVEDGEWRSHTF